jgi:O-methyltransferase
VPETESASVAARRLLQVVETRFADGLSAAREPRASGPAAAHGAATVSKVEALRRAYLDLLKLALADLVATSTTSVARTQRGEVMSRELAGDELNVRAAGMDWPLHGLTMLGLTRLDDLQQCVERLVADKIPGDLVEAGSWRGGAAMLMRATLDTFGEVNRTVWVADSFQGFPAAPEDSDQNGYSLWADLAGADFLAVPLEEVKDAFTRLGLQDGVNFVRVDGDTYDSVRVALDVLYPSLSIGGYLVIDDYHSLDECRAAVEDYRREHHIAEPIDQIDWNGARWRKERQTETLAARVRVAVAPEPRSSELKSVPRGPRQRVPAMAEVELREELQRVQARLHEAEAKLSRLQRAPLAGQLQRVLATARRLRVRVTRGAGGKR